MLSLTHSIDNCVWVCMIRPFKMAVLLFSVYHCWPTPYSYDWPPPLNTYLPLARLVIVLIFRSLDQNLYLHHDNLSKEHEAFSSAGFFDNWWTNWCQFRSITGNTLPKTAAIMSAHHLLHMMEYAPKPSDMYSPPVH